MRRHRRPFQGAGSSLASTQQTPQPPPSPPAVYQTDVAPMPIVDTQPLLHNAVHHPSTTEQHRPQEIRRLRAQAEEQMSLVLRYVHRVVLLELRDFNAIRNFDFESIQRDVVLNWIDMVNAFLAWRELPAHYVTPAEGQRALSGNATRDATWFAEQMHTNLFNNVVAEQVRTRVAFRVEDQSDIDGITSNHNRAMEETLARLLRTLRNWGDRLQVQITDRESEIRNDAGGWRDYERARQSLELVLQQQRMALAEVRAGNTTDLTIESGLRDEGARPLHGDSTNDNGNAPAASVPGGSRDTAFQLD